MLSFIRRYKTRGIIFIPKLVQLLIKIYSKVRILFCLFNKNGVHNMSSSVVIFAQFRRDYIVFKDLLELVQ